MHHLRCGATSPGRGARPKPTRSSPVTPAGATPGCTNSSINRREPTTMTQNPNLAALSAAGVSVWLDDLSRDRLRTGNLAELIDTMGVVGVTTNPTIFQHALSKGHAYDEQIRELAGRGADVDSAIRTITTDDIRETCEVLHRQW